MSVLIKAKEVMKQLIDHNYEAYIVGGYVRDRILGKKEGDIDIATNATPREVSSIFKRTIETGIEHGTITVLWDGQAFEVTTFRTESNYVDNRWPEAVQFVRTFEDDVKRRDFTMNALGLTIDDKIIDHVGGVDDIYQQLIRTVGKANHRFQEDALRMLRAFRFLSVLDFNLDDEAKAAINEVGPLIQSISKERIINEFDLMMKGQAFLKAVNLMKETGFIYHLDFYQPGLIKMLDHHYHPQSEVELYTICTVFKGEEAFSHLPLPNRLKKAVYQSLRLLKEARLSPSLLLKPMTIFKYGLDCCLIVNSILHYFYDKQNQKQAIIDGYQSLPIKTKEELTIDGNMIKQWIDKRPGPWLGVLLDEVIEAVVLGKVKNNSAEIRHFILKKDG